MDINRKFTDKDVVRLARAAVKFEIQKNEILGVPVARYDSSTQTMYIMNHDGTKTILGKRLREGRYSEQQKLRCKKRKNN